MPWNRKLKMSFGVLCNLLLVYVLPAQAAVLPPGFVYLSEVEPSIVQELRYRGYHNFVGRPVKGYEAATGCILTREAAQALKRVQRELRKSSLSLKVYDCYRPQRAVNDFIAWSQRPAEQQMKAEFYPRVNKEELFEQDYIAAKSGHSRGSTMDLTLVPLPLPPQEEYRRGQKLVACNSSYSARFHDNSINMGGGYDCMDEVSHIDYQNLKPTAFYNRLLLSQVMMRYGFKPYAKEWWHFTLKNEPFPKTYFDFPVV